MNRPPKINVIVWANNYACAYTFKRRPIPTDPHYLVVRVNGAEIAYSSCGVGLDDLPNGLPRDAQQITKEQAIALPVYDLAGERQGTE